MTKTEVSIQWDPTVEKKYQTLIAKIPIFHREIARQVVDKKSVINAQERGSSIIEEEDVTRAFVTEVPHIFYSLMARLMDEVGFDYKKYED